MALVPQRQPEAEYYVLWVLFQVTVMGKKEKRDSLNCLFRLCLGNFLFINSFICFLYYSCSHSLYGERPAAGKSLGDDFALSKWKRENRMA